MSATDIAGQRLANQQLTGTKFRRAKEIVGRLGAVQAQDYAMAKWALGIRLPGSTDEIIQRAVDAGEIIRTHILRPTWHFVTADDIRWMLSLTASRINMAMASVNRWLELDDKTFKRCNRIIEKALAGGHHLTRAELMATLGRSGIRTNGIRGIHIMFRAETDGIVCSGARRGAQSTYALLDERVPEAGALRKEEALAELARRYIQSHGPATVHDFAWWSGLTVADAGRGLESIAATVHKEQIGDATYWFADVPRGRGRNDSNVLFLPSYDEFLVGYKDRSVSLDPTHTKKAILANGIFKPVIVVDGRVVGTWRRTVAKDVASIETFFLRSSDRMKKKDIAAATERFGEFTGVRIKVV